MYRNPDAPLPMADPPPPAPGVVVLVWLVRHWFVVLLLVGGLIYLVSPKESDDPRPGYVDTGGPALTEQECVNQGGDPVGDVCYLP